MITVWRVPLNFAHKLPAPRAECLDDVERRRLRRFADPTQGRRWQLAHIALREILGAALGIAPAAVEFNRESSGRTTLAGSRTLHFSLSHAHELALIALGHTHAIGVDLEYRRPVPELAAVLRDVFTQREQDYVADLDPAEAELALLRGWTRKEAVVKALGRGIEAMGQVEVTLEATAPTLLALDAAPAPDWSIADLGLHAPYVGALAVRGRPAHYELRDWTIS